MKWIGGQMSLTTSLKINNPSPYIQDLMTTGNCD